jgi:tetratricopeptide repeat protein
VKLGTALLAFASLASLAAAPVPDDRLREVMERARLRAAGVQPSAGDPVEREQLLAKGEGALARGDVAAALGAFERAASISHTADIEMGLVRAYMQGGEYRRAMAFVAHTAGAHRDVPGGAALYGWLLHIGGQTAHAMRLLDEASVRFAEDELVFRTRRQVQGSQVPAFGEMLRPPARLAPYGSLAGVPASARIAGSGMLIDGGRRALVPLATLAGAHRLWLRNGMGQLSGARLERRLVAEGVGVLVLASALPAGHDPAVVAREPFPGSVAFAVEYPAAGDALPRWPLLTAGFLGGTLDDGGRELGLDLVRGPRGGPVFDAGGRLAGIALAGGSGPDRFVPATRLRQALGDILGNPVPAAASSLAAVDLVYENSLRTTLQVITAR